MSEQAEQPRVSRRGFLGAAGAGALLGAAGGVGATYAATRPDGVAPAVRPEEVIRHRYSPHGPNQAGIVTPTPAVTHLIALDLNQASYSVDALSRLLRVWSADIAALMEGRPVTGDVTPEMAQQGASLTITLGLGPRIFELPGLAAKKPTGFMEIPGMKHDRLSKSWSSGDLLLLIAADDPTTIHYAFRAMVRDAESFATVRWVQEGSWRGTNPDGRGITGRNLFGQVDGSANPKGQALDQTLYPADPPAWFSGGTTLVVRRIEMELDTWDKLTRDQQEKALGRRFSGEPLTGGQEQSQPDFEAKQAGRPVMPLDSHVRRAHPLANGGRQILRRGLNYVHNDVVDGKAQSSTGLIFMSFQANIAQQFVPIQQSVDALDALNTWTTAIGSSVWVIPPGFPADSWIAKGLFS